VQVGFGTQKKERINKGAAGATKGGSYKTLKEFRLKPIDKTDLKEGDVVDVSVFAPGDKIQVSSISKGKGFQGVVKRHGFSGGPRTHGQKHSEREPGSIGGGLRTHVPKGMRMAGRMGSDRITQKNLQVVFVDKENSVMLVKGAIAGKRGSLVEIISR
jgi:large subunit ribosomal protein L3